MFELFIVKSAENSSRANPWRLLFLQFLRWKNESLNLIKQIPRT